MEKTPDIRKEWSAMKAKFKDFWVENEAKIILVIGLILVAVISFEFGVLQGQKWQQKPLIIEKMASQIVSEVGTSAASSAATTSLEGQKTLSQNCQFVGSKNSNKYHSPNCQWAKRIKPENIVCFKSAQEAIDKNYQPDKGCIK